MGWIAFIDINGICWHDSRGHGGEIDALAFVHSVSCPISYAAIAQHSTSASRIASSQTNVWRQRAAARPVPGAGGGIHRELSQLSSLSGGGETTERA